MGSSNKWLLFELLVSLDVVFGAVPSIGSCPKIRGKICKVVLLLQFYKYQMEEVQTATAEILVLFAGISNFDRNKYLGSW